MAIDIQPFHADMVAEAGALLAARHSADRRALPFLPPKFEDPQTAAGAVSAALGRDRATGVAAISQGKLVGFLIGDTVFDTTWGRAGWVRLSGHAIAADQRVELVRDLYAALAERWVEIGCYAHFALVSTAKPTLLDAWFRLSFGVEQMHALCDMTSLAAPGTSQFEIRRGTAEDRSILSSFSSLIWRQQTGAPVWAFTAPERADTLSNDYADQAEDPEAMVWLAFEHGEAVGLQIYYDYPEGADTLYTPPQCLELGVAATLPSARGRGVQSAMTQFCLSQLREQGYSVCETDWRSANLLSSRVWPRLGYVPVVYRLSRRIDPRIAFAAR